MSLATTRALIEDAVAGRTAVLAFNVITLEHAEGILMGAEEASAPVLLQVSENAIRFHHGRFAPLLAACAQLAEDSTASVGIHLDHIKDAVLAEELITLSGAFGVSSIMVDEAERDYAANVERTRRHAAHAHEHQLWVEAELGAIGGKDGAHTPGVRTDPGEAVSFVAATGVDGLAVAVGSSHAMTVPGAELDLPLVAELGRAVPVPLVLHGSSGVREDTLAAAVAAGIRKINLGTGLNVAYTDRVRRALGADSGAVDPRSYLAKARDGIAETVAALCTRIAPATAASPGVRQQHSTRSEGAT